MIFWNGGERGTNETSSSIWGGRVDDVDAEPLERRFSDLAEREGARGSDENRLRLAVKDLAKCRGLDDRLPLSPSSFVGFGGDRDVERLNKLRELCPSVDTAASSELGVATPGISSGVIFIHTLRASESSLE